MSWWPKKAWNDVMLCCKYRTVSPMTRGNRVVWEFWEESTRKEGKSLWSKALHHLSKSQGAVEAWVVWKWVTGVHWWCDCWQKQHGQFWNVSSLFYLLLEFCETLPHWLSRAHMQNTPKCRCLKHSRQEKLFCKMTLTYSVADHAGFLLKKTYKQAASTESCPWQPGW